MSLLVGALVVGVAVAAAAVYDHGRSGQLAPGVAIAGVDVGGMKVAAARERVLHTLAASPPRSLSVAAAGRTYHLKAARIHVAADVDRALAVAQADSRRGWLGTRVAHELSGHRLGEKLPVATHYSTAGISALVARVAARTDQQAVDAAVSPSASGLEQTVSHPGRATNRTALRRALVSAVRDPSRSTEIKAPVSTVAPGVSTSALAAKYPAYIIVDRDAHKLRFYAHLKLTRTYDIAVGQAGLETPAGLYDVQWKQVDPPWIVPNSAWAGDLAGKTIPPGPDDPIKARWMAFDGSAGIHGIDPSEYSSIGHNASHGCVRMRIPDVIDLYAQTPVHSPVFIA